MGDEGRRGINLFHKNFCHTPVHFWVLPPLREKVDLGTLWQMFCGTNATLNITVTMMMQSTWPA